MIYIDTPYHLDQLTSTVLAYTAADALLTRDAEHKLLIRAGSIMAQLGLNGFAIEYEAPSLSYSWNNGYHYLVRDCFARYRTTDGEINNDEAYERIIGIDMDVFNRFADELIGDQHIELSQDYMCSQVALKLRLRQELVEGIVVLKDGSNAPLKYADMNLRIRATIPEEERQTLIELGKIVEEEVVTKQVRATCNVTDFHS